MMPGGELYKKGYRSEGEHGRVRGEAWHSLYGAWHIEEQKPEADWRSLVMPEKPKAI